jgi:DNA-directed RNA polymerase specialized sigma24 family protein
MSGMQDRFDANLRAVFEVAKKYQGALQGVKKRSREDPEGTARWITEYLPNTMDEVREQTAQEWKVDIADLDGLKDAAGSRGLLEAISLFSRADLYHALGELLRRIDEYADDTSLSREKFAKKVCEVAEEALEVEEASKLHRLQLFSDFAKSYGTEEAARRVLGLLGQQLAGHVATRTSTRVNLRLAYALDELRERKKPQSRERLEVLLRELCAKAPEIWDENHLTDLPLRTTRNAVLKKIEQRLPPREYREVELTPFTEAQAVASEGHALPEEIELAAFAAEDQLQRTLKQIREAGLPPRERELFELVAGDPERFLRYGKLNHSEAARAMGVSKGSIKSWWWRIRQTLASLALFC